MERQSLSQVTSTSNIIQFTAPKLPTWMQQATRLYNDGREEFRQVCHIAQICAQNVAFKTDRSFFAFIDRMKIVQKDSSKLNFAIKNIEEVYNEVYQPSCQAEIIPFPMSVQGGGK